MLLISKALARQFSTNAQLLQHSASVSGGVVHAQENNRRWEVECVHCGWAGEGRLKRMRLHLARCLPQTMGGDEATRLTAADAAAAAPSRKPHTRKRQKQGSEPETSLSPAAHNNRAMKEHQVGKGTGKRGRVGRKGAVECYYLPRTVLRECALEPQRTAVLFVDLQNYNCHTRGEMYRRQGGAAEQVVVPGVLPQHCADKIGFDRTKLE